MLRRVVLLLAVFSCYAGVAFSQIKVLKAQKFIDTNAIFYETYKAQCAKWRLSNSDIEYVLSKSEKIDGNEWHYYYSSLPGTYVGEVSINGKLAKFTINAGAVVSLAFKDSAVMLAYNKPDHKKYFVEGRDTEFDVREKFQFDSWYSLKANGIEVMALWSNKFIPTFIDNHSPSWVNRKALLQTSHRKSDVTYSTTTVDGKRINGEVYIIDTIRLGKFTVSSVPVYLIDDGSSREAEAVIGDDVLSSSVVGVFFQRRKITLSDEVPQLGEKEELESSFTKEGISINVSLPNNVQRKLFLDLGFNGGILLPETEFREVSPDNKRIVRRKSRLSTPNGYQVAETSHAYDSVSIDGKQYLSVISTNSYVSERLLGLSFFERFEFLIIDYKHKKVLISKKIVDFSR